MITGAEQEFPRAVGMTSGLICCRLCGVSKRFVEWDYINRNKIRIVNSAPLGSVSK